MFRSQNVKRGIDLLVTFNRINSIYQSFRADFNDVEQSSDTECHLNVVHQSIFVKIFIINSLRPFGAATQQS